MEEANFFMENVNKLLAEMAQQAAEKSDTLLKMEEGIRVTKSLLLRNFVQYLDEKADPHLHGRKKWQILEGVSTFSRKYKLEVWADEEALKVWGKVAGAFREPYIESWRPSADSLASYISFGFYCLDDLAGFAADHNLQVNDPQKLVRKACDDLLEAEGRLRGRVNKILRLIAKNCLKDGHE